MKFPIFSGIPLFFIDLFLMIYFLPFPFLSLLAFVILSLFSVPLCQYKFPVFSSMDKDFCLPIASVCSVRTVSWSFTEEVFSLSCSSFYYELFSFILFQSSALLKILISSSSVGQL